MINCMLTGVGGQGTVLMSRLIGDAAIMRGYEIRGTETIGMAQRGGSVVSHVRIGKDIKSPLIPLGSADVIIAFEPAEAARALPFLKENASMIVLNRAVRPVANALTNDYNGEEALAYLKKQVKNIIVVDGESLIQKCKSAKVINVALLGTVLKKGLLPFSLDDAAAALKQRLPEKFLDLNLKALNIGAEIV